MRTATLRAIRLLTLPLAATALVSPRAAAQTFTWNNTGTAWQSVASWNPTGVPTSSDPTLFGPAGSATGTAATGPTVSGSVAARSLTAGLGQNFGGWNFTGSGTLTMGGGTGLRTEGPQTTTFDGPALAGAGTGGLSLTVANGSTLVLAGATTAATTLVSSIGVYGGTLRLDNAATVVGTRFPTVTIVTVGGGSTLELVGNAAGGTHSAGVLDLSNNSVGGVNSVRVTPLGSSAATVLQFANGTAGTGFSTRPGLRSVLSYEATAGGLGDAKGAQILFTGTPFTGTNGLLSTASGSGSVGFAIVKDSGGTDFATYGVNGVARAGTNAPVTDAAGLATLSGSSRGQFNPAAGSTTTATGSGSPGSLRVTPAGAGATLALGANPLQTNALMLDGPHNFAITGTGTFGSAPAATHYVYVNNAAATLSTSLIVASGANSTVFAGPGFVELTGAGSQNTLGSARFVIAGGTVRANDAQVGFTSSLPGVVSLTGGVLEIKGGSNGTGASADFTRIVGGTAGKVTWGANSSFEAGGGGFSAFGSAASVNLGGAPTPTALRWNDNDFVPTSHALKFGSTQSNAVLTWHNPIALDTDANPTAREFRVTAGTGGDRTVLAGVVSGNATTDFLKTGTGTLVLGAANTYTGRTLVHGGTLTLGATNAVAPAGGLFLGNATLSSGVAGGFSANLGALSLTTGTPTVALGAGAHTLTFTTLAVNVPGLTVTGFTGSRGASGTGGRLVFTGLGGSAPAANASFASFLAGTSFTGYPLGATFLASGGSLELVPAPVPEPAAALGLAALGLGATGLVRRWRAKTPRS